MYSTRKGLTGYLATGHYVSPKLSSVATWSTHFSKFEFSLWEQCWGTGSFSMYFGGLNVQLSSGSVVSRDMISVWYVIACPGDSQYCRPIPESCSLICPSRISHFSRCNSNRSGQLFATWLRCSSLFSEREEVYTMRSTAWISFLIAWAYYLPNEINGLRMLPMRMASSAPKSDRNELSKPKREYRTLRGMPCTGQKMRIWNLFLRNWCLISGCK